MSPDISETPQPKPAEPQTQSGSPPKMPKVVSFETLAACGDEVWIENNGQLYRLRRTSQGKLILTK